MNRHHYGLFIHKCRLVVLLRRQPSVNADNPYMSDVLAPAEWRWNLPEVCDRKWHHYVVSVDSSHQVDYLMPRLHQIHVAGYKRRKEAGFI